MAERPRQTAVLTGALPAELKGSVELSDLIGKTVAAVWLSSAPGDCGEEPMTVLIFTDGTNHGFVHPRSE